MIVKKSKGYYVEGSQGKNLGGPYKTKREAEVRLKEIEMFKAMNKGKKRIGAFRG